jgi:type II secretory pathway component PulF
MALMYAVGGHRVEQMIRTAASSVSNHAARLEFIKAATAIEQQASLPEAFRRVNILSDDEWSAIETGELSGTLETAFEQISEDSGASLTAKIKLIEPLLLRFVMFIVVMSVISTLMGLWM